MKKLILTLSLITSFQAMALTCTSEENAEKKLLIENYAGNLVQAKLFEDSVTSVFAGKIAKPDQLFTTTYNLFDQNGEKYTFNLMLDLGSGHCRTRVCNDPSWNQGQTGKLSKEGLEDEYFTCL